MFAYLLTWRSNRFVSLILAASSVVTLPVLITTQTDPGPRGGPAAAGGQLSGLNSNQV